VNLDVRSVWVKHVDGSATRSAARTETNLGAIRQLYEFTWITGRDLGAALRQFVEHLVQLSFRVHLEVWCVATGSEIRQDLTDSPSDALLLCGLGAFFCGCLFCGLDCFLL
jgi:hypothetical protein